MNHQVAWRRGIVMAEKLAQFVHREPALACDRAATNLSTRSVNGVTPPISAARRLARGVVAVGAVISQLVFITIDALHGRYDA